jgi:hypothetical protein
VISERSYVLEVITRDYLALFEPIVPLEQVADILMSKWQATIVVLLEELQIILTHRITLPAFIYHCIENY